MAMGWVCLVAAPCFAGETVRARVEPGIFAALKDGRQMFLECRPPAGDAARPYLARLLANPAGWEMYRNRAAVAIKFDAVRPDMQRAMLLAVFLDDYVDEAGWWHSVGYAEKEGVESLWSLCEWVTGRGTTYRAVMEDPHNRNIGPALQKGQRVLIPRAMLLEIMRTPTPRRIVEEEKAPAGESNGDALTYGKDARGAFACYSLKQGEALYTAVVVRFTDYHDNEDIMAACARIQQRSGIKDVTQMEPGDKILIPLEMLSDRFQPKESTERKAYEASIQEARRLRQERPRTRDLEGVVVIIDAGHGGRDQGCESPKLGLFEDEINYDVACRVKRLLETETQAKVHMTVLDPSEGFEPRDRTTFDRDTDEVLLTTPHHPNNNAKVSANIRWMLANSIYKAETAKGVDPRKVVFTSFHTDYLMSSLRGTMIYIPGADHRREKESHTGAPYTAYRECRENGHARSTLAERRRDEAMSRNLADEVMRCLGEKRVRRHLEGPWIRSKIKQDNGDVYVPAVLRNSAVPTKILIEMANMNNATDCSRLADPEWRETFAEAYVDALKAYYGS